MSDREEIAKQIFELLTEKPQQTAREIAKTLGLEKKEVNSILYSDLKSFCSIDDKYRWSVKGTNPDNVNFENQITDRMSFDPNNPLSKLCTYYLSCLSFEDEGISVFADSKFDLDYFEVESFCDVLNGRNSFHPSLKKLIEKSKKNSTKKELYFGYPSVLKKIISKKSQWEGMIAAPIILYPVNNDSDGIKVNFNMPFFNLSVIKDLSKVDREDLINELLALEDKLGFSKSDSLPEIDDMISLLRDFREEWPWKEEPDPSELIVSPALKDIHEEGIYNRALFLSVERSPYTQGLESELSQLSKFSLSNISGSSLASWVNGDVEESVDDVSSDELIEVLPMNLEQRLAVKSALSNKLTVVTGPPGTGKSQVVTNILINAAWSGKKILFASKNNQAVDVVETRVNSLGSRPILLRLGTGKYMSALAEYLLDIMSSVVSQDDKQNYEFYLHKHKEIEKKLDEITNYQNDVISLRNLVDEKDRKLSILRELYPQDIFKKIGTIDIARFRSIVKGLKSAVLATDREKNNFAIRTLWSLAKKGREEELQRKLSEIKPFAEELNLTLPNKDSLDSLYGFLDSLDKILADYDLISDFDHSYQALLSKKTLEDLSKDIMKLLAIKSSNEQALWSYWVKIQSERLSDSVRSELGDYVGLLKIIMASSDDLYSKLGKKLYHQYLSLSEKISTLLPAFAITSLSARGKIPLIDSFFDIVIFDEASQCDIASALPLLFRAKHAVVIGDSKQLSHISSIRTERDQKLLERFDLINGYMKWSYSANSLFDLATFLVKSKNIVNLKDHHRSHADIIEFSNNEFYNGALRVATKYDCLKFIDNAGGIRWVNVVGKVYRPSAGGAVNEIEARQVVSELQKIVFTQKYQGSLGVVTPFREQANLIRRLVASDNSLQTELARHDFLVDTVHKFQGDERDVMLFSSVVSNGMPPSALSFLRNSGNLFNVAITRARAQLIVVGDESAMANCDIKYYKDFATYVSSLTNKKKKEDASLLDTLGPKYPTVAKPELVSDWEIYFYEEAYKAGLCLIPQYNLEKYILDFAYVDGDRKLDIEIDGEHYHRDWNGELCYRDQLRNQRVFELGWDVKRFWVYEVRDDIAKCIKKIKEW